MKLKTPSGFAFAIGLLVVATIARAGAAAPAGHWKKLAPPPRQTCTHQGLTAASDGKCVYALFGSAGFWRYDTVANTWQPLAPPPISDEEALQGLGTLHYPGTGSSLYYLVSRRSNRETLPVQLLSYSIPGNSWDALPAPPVPASRGLGVALTSNGDFLYAMIGGTTTDFLRYSISTAAWVHLAPVPGVQRSDKSNLFERASLAYPGSGPYIYAVGIYDAILWRYSVPLDRWDRLASPPNWVGDRGGLVYPGKGDCLYAVSGNNWSDGLWRYSISRNTWTTMAAISGGIHFGGALTSGDDNTLYAFMAKSVSHLDEIFEVIQYLASMTVADEPVASLPAPITAGATSASGAVVTYESGASVACTPASGSLFPIGTTTVNCTATDATGNTPAGSFTVSVADNTAPILRVPTDITVSTSRATGAVVAYEVTATDLIDKHPVVTCDPASGSTFRRGGRLVGCTARDASGNVSGDSFTVRVVASVVNGNGPAAQVWLGVKKREDVGTKFDLLAEMFCGGVLVGSGQTNDVSGGGRGFDNAVLRGITLALSGPLCPERDTSVRLSVRIADTSDRESGTARLWFNDWVADSRVALPFWATGTRDWFLKKGRVLARASGYPPNPKKKTIDVLVRRGDGFRPFGTWTLKD